MENASIPQMYAREVEKYSRTIRQQPPSMLLNDLANSISQKRQDCERKSQVDEWLSALECELDHLRMDLGAMKFWEAAGLTPVRVPYRMTYIDSWFLHHLDSAYARLYNSVQRMANVLDCFFHLEAEETRVFPGSIKKLAENAALCRNTASIKLVEYINDEFNKTVNVQRIEFVHYSGAHSGLFWAFTQEIIRNQSEVCTDAPLLLSKWSDELIHQFNLLMEAVVRMHELIAECA